MAEDQLEQELASLLEQEWFEPPEEFRANALVSDMSVHEEAERDPVGWWEEQARASSWSRRWDQALDERDAPFYRWFAGGKLNVSHNCLDRHVAAGIGERVAFHWHGEEGETRDVTYAELLADVQRCANALKAAESARRRRGHLPADDPRGRRRDARLHADRRAAQRRVRRLLAESVAERMEFSDAKALITVDGARRKGKTAPVKPRGGRRRWATSTRSRRSSSSATPVTGLDAGRARHLVGRGARGGRPGLPAEPLDAEHPLFILYSSGSTAKPKGILHTTGGYLTGVAWTFKHVFDLKPESDVYWCSADVGWITGTATSSTARSPTARRP